MLLFLDESGYDHGEAPYEVLAGVAVRESDLWNLIQAVRAAKMECFGVYMIDVDLNSKARNFSNAKFSDLPIGA